MPGPQRVVYIPVIVESDEVVVNATTIHYNKVNKTLEVFNHEVDSGETFSPINFAELLRWAADALEVSALPTFEGERNGKQ